MKKIAALCIALASCFSGVSFAAKQEPVKQTVKVVNSQSIGYSAGATIWVDGGLYISQSKTDLSPSNSLSKLVSKSINTFTIQTDDPRKTDRSDWFGNIHVRLYGYDASQNDCYQEASVNIPARIENNKIVLEPKVGGYTINADQMTYSNERCGAIKNFMVTVTGDQDAGYEINTFGIVGR